MLSDKQKKQLQKADYRLVCGHGAVKLCLWCKKSVKSGEKDICYKQMWYGIKSHRCLQLTPLITACNLRCEYCWRNHAYFSPKVPEHVAKPKELVDQAIKAQRALLTGLGGVDHSPEHLKEAQEPLSAAISLDGEPTLYPYIKELISEFHSRNIQTFLVTNGTNPDIIANLDPLPTNLYISLTSPTQEIFNKLQHPTSPDLWQNLMKTLELLPTLKTNKVIRLTLIKGINMNPELYVDHIKKAKPNHIEIKSWMAVGASRTRLNYNQMVSISELYDFAKKLSLKLDYEIKDLSKASRVVLLSK